MSNGAWVLVVIGLNGNPDSSMYPTEAACQDARSIALTGLTVAGVQADEEVKKEKHKQWYVDHRPRPPKGIAERAILKAASGGLNYHNSHMSYHVTSDGLIQDDPPVETTPIAKVQSAQCLAPKGD